MRKTLLAALLLSLFATGFANAAPMVDSPAMTADKEKLRDDRARMHDDNRKLAADRRVVSREKSVVVKEIEGGNTPAAHVAAAKVEADREQLKADWKQRREDKKVLARDLHQLDEDTAKAN